VAELARPLRFWREPERQIQDAAAYLPELHDRYGAAYFLAADNAGPARYGIIWRAVDHFLPRRAPTLPRSHRRSPTSRLMMR
jgi:hypothetical protein